MLFRKSDGTFIEINRGDYKNETLYYTKVMNLKKTSLALKVTTMDAFVKHKSGSSAKK
jgi:hypothetical protein